MTDTSYPTDPVAHSRVLESLRKERGEQFEANPELKNSMGYWFPPFRDVIAEIPDLQTPDTLFVDLTRLNGYEIAHERDDISDAELESIMKCPAEWDVKQIQRAISEIGSPVFVRTDTDSAKENIHAGGKIESNDEETVNETIDALIRGVGGNSGMMGAPRFNFLAVREWIDIDSSFTAFDGTPIGPEVRLFAEDGDVHCHHFYWPFHNVTMRRSVDGEYDPVTERKVELMESIVDAAVDEHLADAAAAVSEADAFTGEWSIDFALTTDGTWYGIDMARGPDSWHPDTCPRTETEPEPDTADDEIEELLEDIDEDI